MIYSKEKDSFHFDIGGNHHVHAAVWMIASKALVGNWYMISHGPEVNVKERFKKMIDTFESAGLQEDADGLYLFDASLFGIEEINKCLEITNYISNLVEADILQKDLIKHIC